MSKILSQQLNNLLLMKTKIILILILSIGLVFRISGLNWDQGKHLHPDERFLTMVLGDIKIPQNIAQYIDPQKSTLNPYNQGYSFYVYGSLPLNLVKFIGVFLKQDSYDQIYLVGRIITILLDTLVILLIYLICKNIFNTKVALISAFLYSICVLPIQLSRFYTVDPFLNFFIILSFYFLIKISKKQHQLVSLFCLSISFSLALTSKITAVYFLVVIFIFFVLNFKNDLKKLVKYGLTFLFLTVILVRFLQPQFFSNGNYFDWHINPQFLNNLNELKSWDKNPSFPPAIQWIKVKPIWFPFKNISIWGLGLPFSLLFIISLGFCLVSIFKNRSQNSLYLAISIFWIIFLFILQGSQSVSTMRYFLPIYPFICLTTGFFLNYIFKKNIIIIPIIGLLIIYPLMFALIATKMHTRVSASEWIYKNIPPGSVIATEYWDDPLPISLNNNDYNKYQILELNVASLEDNQKMDNLMSEIDKSDYLILSSNRFYKPIPENFDIFPQTTRYYQSLFDGTLGFKKIAEFTSYPCLFNFCLNDDSSEEAFTVYDHPKVIIFQKVLHTGQ